MNTMKMPENSAVMATAMFIVVGARPSSSPMSGAMLSVVWANSQNVSTPRTMPNSTRSLPAKCGGCACAGLGGVSMPRPPAVLPVTWFMTVLWL